MNVPFDQPHELDNELGIAADRLLICGRTLQPAFGPIPRRTIGLGTGPVHGTRSEPARLSRPPVLSANAIEVPSTRARDVTEASANALTV